MPPAPISYTPEALKDEIINLPGLNEAIGYRHFAGYLPISESKNMFYWYVEAAEKSEEAPLLLWTNGGPGCSGLFGLMNENGPFRPTKGGESVTLNPYAWTTVSNMLFIEQPVTVGFSYSTKEEDNHTFGDDIIAADNYLILQTFYARYPHLRSHDLYLSSESYGGHYLPTLSKYIIDKNAEINQEQTINLKGFVVGNPATDPVEQLIGQVDSLFGHQLIPQNLYDEWTSQCVSSKPDLDQLKSTHCRTMQNRMWSKLHDIDPYALSYPICASQDKGVLSTSTSAPSSTDSGSGSGRSGYNGQDKGVLSTLFLTASSGGGGNRGGSQQSFLLKAMNASKEWSTALSLVQLGELPLAYEPCQAGWSASYLNRADFKAAIRAKPETTWVECSPRVLEEYDHRDYDRYMEPIYQYLLEEHKGLRIVIYSGDDDTVCSTRGSQWWLNSMHWPVSEDWRHWTINDQVAGYMRRYQNGLIFKTVHSAGHEVPAFKPEAALDIITKFLNNQH